MSTTGTKTSNFLIRSKKEFLPTKRVNKLKPISSGNPCYFRIEPRVLKFKGYEVDKANIKKLIIVNTSSQLQRLTVLPAHSENFDFFFEKKGKLAPGMGQEIKISLLPKKHSYYNTSIKVISENEEFLIPIHAFPVMNQSKRGVFPSLIDFGIREMKKTHEIVKQLKCAIPINFEYEFKLKKKDKAISIRNPKGIVPGNGVVDIVIEFRPEAAKTIVSEVEVR